MKTRKIIADKFRQLHKERVSKEKKYKEKYTPIADAIEKVIENKELTIDMTNGKNDHRQKYVPSLIAQKQAEASPLTKKRIIEMTNDQFNENQQYVSSLIAQKQPEASPLANPINASAVLSDFSSQNEMEFESGNAKRRREEDVFAGNVNKKKRKNRENNIHSTRINDATKTTSKRGKKVRDLDTIREAERMFILNRRKEKKEQKNDIARIHSSSKNIAQSDEIAQNLGNSNISRNDEIAGEKKLNDSTPLHNDISSKQKRYILSPDDYDLHGHFKGTASKRRKIEMTGKQYEKSKYKKQARRKKPILFGKGLHKFIPYSENIVYEYYDDPNELVDRLRLLISSKGAGNSNHYQEINSIVDELKERNIIA